MKLDDTVERYSRHLRSGFGYVEPGRHGTDARQRGFPPAPQFRILQLSGTGGMHRLYRYGDPRHYARRIGYLINRDVLSPLEAAFLREGKALHGQGRDLSPSSARHVRGILFWPRFWSPSSISAISRNVIANSSALRSPRNDCSGRQGIRRGPTFGRSTASAKDPGLFPSAAPSGTASSAGTLPMSRSRMPTRGQGQRSALRWTRSRGSRTGRSCSRIYMRPCACGRWHAACRKPASS